MKKMLAVSMLLMCAAQSFGAVGSRDIERWEGDHQGQIAAVENTATMIGGALAPTTGGTSMLIAKIFSMLTAVFFGVNRAIAAHKRKRIIKEVEDNPHTPSVLSQVRTAASRAAVNALSSG